MQQESWKGPAFTDTSREGSGPSQDLNDGAGKVENSLVAYETPLQATKLTGNGEFLSCHFFIYNGIYIHLSPLF